MHDLAAFGSFWAGQCAGCCGRSSLLDVTFVVTAYVNTQLLPRLYVQDAKSTHLDMKSQLQISVQVCTLHNLFYDRKSCDGPATMPKGWYFNVSFCYHEHTFLDPALQPMSR